MSKLSYKSYQFSAALSITHLKLVMCISFKTLETWNKNNKEANCSTLFPLVNCLLDELELP